MLNSEITEDSDSFETPLTAGPEKYKKVQKNTKNCGMI